jgi:uncharacterized protein with FMN-binding domain
MRSTDRPASLGRRVWPAVALAGASGLLLKAIDQPEAAVGSLRVGAAPTTTPPKSAGSASTATTVPPSTSATTPATGNGSTASTAAPTSTVPPAPAKCTGTQHTGPTVDTRWGPVQVVAVVSASGQVCSADAPVTPSDRNRSVWINQQAVPLINQEIPEQGVNFLSVIGATVTSNGYRSSLQAILDSLGK